MSAIEIVPVASAEIAGGVSEREYRRLLALPRRGAMPARLVELAQAARQWYALNGEPFVATRRVDVDAIDSTSVTLATGDVLSGAALAERLLAGEAHAVVVVAASAGARVAEEAARRWAEDRPDESYFIDRFAAAVAESLVLRASAGLCGSRAALREQVLPPLSPGCGHWDIADQRQLMGLLSGRPPSMRRDVAAATLGPVALLESGALSPQHSVLAVLGVAQRPSAATPERACRGCELDPCSFRRVPFTSGTLRPRVTP